MNLREVKLDPDYLKDLESRISLEDFLSLIEEGKRRLGHKFVEIRTQKPVIFIGDLHGDIDTIFRIFDKIGLDEVLERYVLVFLGDYVDRGPNQIASLILPLALKARKGEDVVVLRGNHEPPEWLPVYPNDFKEEVLPSKFGDKWRLAYNKALELFESMAFSAKVNEVIAVHGGLPFRKLKTCEGNECLIPENEEDVEDVLWSDPDEICKWNDPLELCIEKNFYRGGGKIWGAGATRAILEKTGARMIVRGHTPVDGFGYSHNRRVLTLFTRLGLPYSNNLACVAVFNEEIETVCVQ